MNFIRISLLLSLIITTMGEEIPESVKKGEWQTKWDGTKLPQGRIPDDFWSHVPRKFILVRMTKVEFKSMVDSKTVQEFVNSKKESDEDIIKIVYGDKAGEWLSGEFAPVPTPEQEVWARKLSDSWLVPVPDGYVSSSEGGGISTWDKWLWNNTSRIRVARGASPMKKLGVSGGPSDNVFWYDRPISDEEMLNEVASHQPDLKITKLDDQYIAEHRRIGKTEGWKDISWPSGQFLVSLKMPDRLYPQHVKAYLGKYPSRWKNPVEYDPQALILRVLDRELNVMIENVDGPLEWLRYSFRTYPFDDAFHRIRWIIPRSGTTATKVVAPNGQPWLTYHNAQMEAIHAAWVKAPTAQLKLSDYHDAVVAYRKNLIQTLSKVRAVIARDGVGYVE